MFLMFVDESGDTGLVRSPTRYFILCGMVLHELRWDQHVNTLLAFRQDMKARFGLKFREEIHATDLINNPGPLNRIPKHHRLEIVRSFADCLGSMTDINLISVVVDKQGKATGYDVFQKAWEALIQRFENTISHHNFPGPRNPDERGMLICDNTDGMKLVRLVRRMRVYNPIPNRMDLRRGYRNMALRFIIEDPNFRDSQHAQMIQAVDLCAWLLKQMVQPCGYMRKKYAAKYFLRMQNILCRVAAPRDPQGVVRL
jgi:hypothetical protein